MKTAMAITSRCTGLAFLLVLSALSRGEALFGRGKGGGGGAAVVGGKGPQAAASKIDPERVQAAASQASERIMMWGTSTIFQLKEAAQLKEQVQRLQKESPSNVGASEVDGETNIKMDTPMYKEITRGALGGAFLMLNSPNMGKVSGMAKSLMKDVRRQARVIDLDHRVQEAFAKNKAKPTLTKGMKGFLEGALLNKGVAEAHEKFMADVEALSSSGLAKKVAASAEAYHHAMLVYATNEES